MTSVPDARFADVLGTLDETNCWGLKRFSDPEYLRRRRRVEDQIRVELISRGGHPELDRPIYCFLGRNQDFERSERNRGYSVALRDLPEGVLTFTYGDSLLGLDPDYRKVVGEDYSSHLCGRIFCFGDLAVLRERTAVVPSLHVEVQLWARPAESIVKILER